MMQMTELNRLKEILKEQGRTGSWLARKIEKDPATVSRWCSNKQQPSIETLYKIAHVLDINVYELLNKNKQDIGSVLKIIVDTPCQVYCDYEYKGNYCTVKLNDKNNETSTKIYVSSLCSVIQGVVDNLRIVFSEGKLKFKTAETEEIETKYTIIYE